MIVYFKNFQGVKIIEDCYVTEILSKKQRAGQNDCVTNAVTSRGDIKCDVFINCTGMVNLCVVFVNEENLAREKFRMMIYI